MDHRGVCKVPHPEARSVREKEEGKIVRKEIVSSMIACKSFGLRRNIRHLLAGGNAADLGGVLGPRLQVLQGEQRAIL